MTQKSNRHTMQITQMLFDFYCNGWRLPPGKKIQINSVQQHFFTLLAAINFENRQSVAWNHLTTIRFPSICTGLLFNLTTGLL